MSFEPVIVQKKPFILEEEAGKKRAWCSCGLSSGQPFCDGSHAKQQTGMVPVMITCENSTKIAYCGCKQTKNPPYCDGSHAHL